LDGTSLAVRTADDRAASTADDRAASTADDRAADDHAAAHRGLPNSRIGSALGSSTDTEGAGLAVGTAAANSSGADS